MNKCRRCGTEIPPRRRPRPRLCFRCLADAREQRFSLPSYEEDLEAIRHIRRERQGGE